MFLRAIASRISITLSFGITNENLSRHHSFCFYSFLILDVTQAKCKRQLFKAGFCGVVVGVERSQKGNFHLRIIDNGKMRSVGYRPSKDSLFVNIRDSVCKQPRSQVYLIRKREEENFIKVEWKSAFISGEWED